MHELLLEQRHPEGLGQRRLQQRVQVGDLLPAPPSVDVGVDRVALDRAGADEGDLDDDVVEVARPQDRKSTRLNSSHVAISYAVFCLKKKTKIHTVVII